jgi:NTE family protein
MRLMNGSGIAVVLGGGGALGWVYHAGFLSALQQRGITAASVSTVIGTSAGAAVAASMRAGADPAEIVSTMGLPPSPEQRDRVLQGVRAAPKSLRPLSPRLARDAFHTRGNSVLALAGVLPRGLFPTAFTEQFPGIPDLDGWPDGLWVPATRADDGNVVVFGRDRRDVTVADAVEASSAVPGMFQPKRIDGVDYIDGGVVSPTHAYLALDVATDLVLVSSPMTRPSRRFLARHARRRLADEVAQLRITGKRVVVVEPTEELLAIADGFPRRNPNAAPRIADQAQEDVAAACARAGL